MIRFMEIKKDGTQYAENAEKLKKCLKSWGIHRNHGDQQRQGGSSKTREWWWLGYDQKLPVPMETLLNGSTSNWV